MKQLLGILLAVILMPASTSFALVGGPFGGDSYYSAGSDGVYEAIATMSNGIGMYRFAVRNNSLSGQATDGSAGGLPNLTSSSNLNFGNSTPNGYTHTWYYKGVVYGGNCYGIANETMGIVSATGNATTTSGLVQTQIVGGAAVQVGGNVFTQGPSGANVVFANSAFVADIDESYPVLRFSGKGTVSFLGQVDSTTETRTITELNSEATDVDIQTNTTSASGSTTTDITQNGNTSITDNNVVTDTSTGGEEEAFSQVGHNRSFLVFGSRVSIQILP